MQALVFDVYMMYIIIIIIFYIALFTSEGLLKGLQHRYLWVTGPFYKGPGLHVTLVGSRAPLARTSHLSHECLRHLIHSFNHLSYLGSIQHVLQICATRQNQSQEPSLPSHRYPFTPGCWREAIIVKCLAQGHNCHDRDSNPSSAKQKNQSLSSVLLSARPRHTVNGSNCIKVKDNTDTFSYFKN